MPDSTPLIYLITGEPFLCEQKARKLMDSFSNSSAVSIIRYFADETKPEELLGELTSFPLFASKQIVHIKRIELLTKDAKNSLLKYIGCPNDFTLLILEGGSFDGRDEFFRILSAKCKVINYTAKDKPSLASLIKQKIEASHKRIEPDALRLLEERSGDDLFLLDNAVDNLILYGGEKEVLDSDMVRRVTEEFLSFDNFELTDSLLGKNPDKALRVFRHLLERRSSTKGDAIGMVIGMINWQLRKLLDRRGGQFPRETVEGAIARLFQLDFDITRGIVQPTEGLEAMIVELATSKQGIVDSR
ncbi:MAG: DNA polymerase III subunit delta [Candidatus Omnitrophica bacterium]|nr:DNA polymerase III subunit delta [Candidatus Omnitrophota bacterium]